MDPCPDPAFDFIVINFSQRLVYLYCKLSNVQINFEINIINIRREITKYLSNNENIETTLYDEKLLNVQLLLLIKNEMYSSLLLTSFYFLEKLTVRRYFKKSAISFQKQ